MTLKGDAIFKEKLIGGLKNDMRSLVNFHVSSCIWLLKCCEDKNLYDIIIYSYSIKINLYSMKYIFIISPFFFHDIKIHFYSIKIILY